MEAEVKIVSTSKVKNTLASHLLVNQLIAHFVEIIKKVPNYEVLRMDKELIKKICKDVYKTIKSSKTLTKEQKKLISKSEIVCQIFIQVFQLNVEELSNIRKDIEFLLNNSLIKKSWLKKLCQLSSKLV